jgi:hypothetical protein
MIETLTPIGIVGYISPLSKDNGKFTLSNIKLAIINKLVFYLFNNIYTLCYKCYNNSS